MGTNIEVSGGQESKLRDYAIYGFKKADVPCDTKQPINH